jgi:N-methylhydantoinase B
MMEEYKIADLDALSQHILSASDISMREAIAKLPKGTWSHAMRIDGFDQPLDLKATLTIETDIIRIDFAGTSGVSRYGINCPLCYTDAYTSFGVKCLVAPRLANNAAVLARISVTAPDNCIVNALFPAPVTARAVIGQMLPDVVFGCFAQAMPGKVPAEGTGASWSLRLGAGPGITGDAAGQGTPFMSQTFQSGGMGAHPKLDGLAATLFRQVKGTPTRSRATTPPSSEKGAARRFRWQRKAAWRTRPEIGSREDAPFAIFARFQRRFFRPAVVMRTAPCRHRPSGVRRDARRAATGDPERRPAIVEMPGGGGLGNAAERDPALWRKTCATASSARRARVRFIGLVRDDGSQMSTRRKRGAADESPDRWPTVADCPRPIVSSDPETQRRCGSI